jgi:hypothetical protein
MLFWLAAAGTAALGTYGLTWAAPSESTWVIVLPRPPFSHVHRGVKRGARPSLRLSKLSERRNEITDEEAWFERHQLSLPTLESDLRRGIRGRLPEKVPERFAGERLIRAIESRRQILLIYGVDFATGRYLVAFDPVTKHPQYALDFRRYLPPPVFLPRDREFVDEAVQWAEEAGDVLYVANFHRTYAKSSGGLNGYLNAIEPRTGRLRWRSRPLVCNSLNFVIRGNAVICGYGFTAEPDYLYVLDRRTGEVVQQVRVRSAPEYLIPKGDRLFVRTYDTDYVFRITGESRRADDRSVARVDLGAPRGAAPTAPSEERPGQSARRQGWCSSSACHGRRSSPGR